MGQGVLKWAEWREGQTEAAWGKLNWIGLIEYYHRIQRHSLCVAKFSQG